MPAEESTSRPVYFRDVGGDKDIHYVSVAAVAVVVAVATACNLPLATFISGMGLNALPMLAALLKFRPDLRGEFYTLNL